MTGDLNETEWKENYKLWMTFINEYRDRGGRVTAGADSGHMYNLYGFGFVQELELLREWEDSILWRLLEPGLQAAEAIGMDDKIGTAEVGKYADITVMDQNPLKI